MPAYREPKRIDLNLLGSGRPQVIMRRGFHNRGRPQIVPIGNTRNPTQFRKSLGKKVKDMTPAQRRAYNRIASRQTYAREKTQQIEGLDATEYKKILKKPIKKFTKQEKQKYDRLSKTESRIKKNISI